MGDVHLHFVLAIRIDEDYLLGDRIGQDGSQRTKDILKLGCDSGVASILDDTNAIDPAFFENNLLYLFYVLRVDCHASCITESRSVNNCEICLANLDLILRDIASLGGHPTAKLVFYFGSVEPSAALDSLNAFNRALNVCEIVQKRGFSLSCAAEKQNSKALLDLGRSIRKNLFKDIMGNPRSLRLFSLFLIISFVFLCS